MPFDESSQAAPQPDVLCWENGAILVGDVRTALQEIPEKSVHCVVTSPPYFGLRSYLPGVVKLKSTLSSEKRTAVLAELAVLRICPVDLTSK